MVSMGLLMRRFWLPVLLARELPRPDCDPVRVQILGEKISGRARTATPEERSRLWPLMAKLYPPYDSYQAKTERQIPVVIVEPEK